VSSVRRFYYKSVSSSEFENVHGLSYLINKLHTNLSMRYL